MCKKIEKGEAKGFFSSNTRLLPDQAQSDQKRAKDHHSFASATKTTVQQKKKHGAAACLPS